MPSKVGLLTGGGVGNVRRTCLTTSLTARTTHVKTAWIRRGNGIPGSDQSTYIVHITRHEDLLTIVTIQGPGPDEGAILIDQIEALLRGLPPLYCLVLDLRLQGHGSTEVAAHLNHDAHAARRDTAPVGQLTT